MRIFVDERLRREREEFSLAATCDHCVHFDDDTQGCSLTYPNGVHREAHLEALQDGDVVLFCKTFEVD